MNFISTYFAPTVDQLIGLGAVLLVGLGLAVIGAAIGGRNRYVAADVMVGWGATALVFTLVGTLTRLPFTTISLFMAVVAIACGAYVWRRDRRLIADGAGKIMIMIVLLFVLVAAMEPSQWDEYSHWLPAARYLFEVDGFPRMGMPAPLADYPGYPTGQSLIPYMVSIISQRFVENASSLFHILLLVSLALAAIDIIRRGAGLDSKAKAGWGLCALGFMTVTIFSTAFVQKIIFTAYADLPVAAAVAFTGLLGWLILDALANNDGRKAWGLSLQAGLVLVVLLSVKPATIVLEVGILVGIVIAVLRDPDIPFGQLLKRLPLILVPGFVILLIWSWFSSRHFPLGSQTIMPFDLWQWQQMPQTLSTMGIIMLKKSPYFAMMWTISALSLVAIFRYRTRFDRFALITGSTFVGYNLFLAFVYLAIYGGYPGANALSYWRYNMHLAHLGVFCATYGLSVLWQYRLAERMTKTLPHLARVGVLLLVILPLFFAPKIRFDIRAPKQFVKQVGIEMREMLPPSARLLIIDPLSAGFYTKLMRYQLYGTATLTEAIHVISDSSAKGVRDLLERTKSDYVWVHTQNPTVVEGLGVELPNHHAHLLEKQGTQWQLIKSWPYPGYNQPQDIPD
ncbi:MAG: hypothetical protein HQ483_19470 [Rhodospirillales bacterium]|nr:hypothetical protein [Rhodospirillales bacterium]